MRSYRDATDALRELFRLEKERPTQDIVLVRADSSNEVRLAFKNYFTDARDFIRLLETGCAKLSNTKNILDVYKPVTQPQKSKGPKGKDWWLTHESKI